MSFLTNDDFNLNTSIPLLEGKYIEIEKFSNLKRSELSDLQGELFEDVFQQGFFKCLNNLYALTEKSDLERENLSDIEKEEIIHKVSKELDLINTYNVDSRFVMKICAFRNNLILFEKDEDKKKKYDLLGKICFLQCYLIVMQKSLNMMDDRFILDLEGFVENDIS